MNFSSYSEMPAELKQVVGEENAEFVIRTRNVIPLWKPLVKIAAAGILSVAFTGIIAGGANGCCCASGRVAFLAIGIPVAAVTVLGFLISGMCGLYRRKFWYVATNKGLVIHKEGKCCGYLRILPWKELTGDIHVYGSKKVGTLYLAQKQANMRCYYGFVTMHTVPDPYAVARVCQNKIRQYSNDSIE